MTGRQSKAGRNTCTLYTDSLCGSTGAAARHVSIAQITVYVMLCRTMQATVVEGRDGQLIWSHGDWKEIEGGSQIIRNIACEVVDID